MVRTMVFALAVVCVAGCDKSKEYVNKSKTMEARILLKQLYEGARSYYMDQRSAGITPTAPQFPEPSVGPTPPLGTCCKNEGKCTPRQELWTAPTWIALRFSVDDPHYYSYQYEVKDKGKEFVVRAFGDLDCDGTYSTFEMVGTINPELGAGVSGSGTLIRTNPLE